VTYGASGEQGSYGATWMMAAAVLLIGVGTVLRQLDVSTVLVILALLAAGVAVLAPYSAVLSVFRRRSVVMVLVAGVTLLAAISATQSTLPIPLRFTLLAIAGIGIHAVLVGGKSRTIEMLVVIAGHFALMAVMLAVSGPPDIDVYYFQQEASEALLNGENPYALRYLNTAGPNSPYYADELIDGDRLNFGFLYPPLSLVLAVPGYALAGDYRYAALACVSLTALLIVLMRPGQLAAGAALAVLFAPMTAFVLYWGWTESFVVLPFAATVYLAVRRAATTPVALGFLIASKQYMPVLLVLAVVLMRDLGRRVGRLWFAVIPLAVAVATVIPFVIWDAGSFIYSTVTVHVLQPFRDDSISVGATLVRIGLPATPEWLGFILGALALLLIAWRAPRTPAALSAGSAVVLITFYLFSKQAHLNYFFPALVALAIAIAVAEPDETAAERALA
jgi:hypothetical protein